MLNLDRHSSHKCWSTATTLSITSSTEHHNPQQHPRASSIIRQPTNISLCPKNTNKEDSLSWQFLIVSEEMEKFPCRDNFNSVALSRKITCPSGHKLSWTDLSPLHVHQSDTSPPLCSIPEFSAISFHLPDPPLSLTVLFRATNLTPLQNTTCPEYTGHLFPSFATPNFFPTHHGSLHFFPGFSHLSSPTPPKNLLLPLSISMHVTPVALLHHTTHY